MRKIISLLLGLVFTVGLVGCTTPTIELISPENGTSTTSPVTFTWGSTRATSHLFTVDSLLEEWIIDKQVEKELVPGTWRWHVQAVGIGGKAESDVRLLNIPDPGNPPPIEPYNRTPEKGATVKSPITFSWECERATNYFLILNQQPVTQITEKVITVNIAPGKVEWNVLAQGPGGMTATETWGLTVEGTNEPPVNSRVTVKGDYFMIDGKPTVLMGDHSWSFAEEFTLKEWEQACDAWQARGYNCVQFSAWLSKYSRGTAECGGGPYGTAGGNCPGTGSANCWEAAIDAQVINDQYFEKLKTMVEIANEHGLCCIVSIGGFPVNSNWWKKFKYQPREDRFWTRVISDLSPLNVIWVLYGEVNEADPPWTTWEKEVQYKINLIRRVDAYNHPIGSHHTPVYDSSSVGQVDYIVGQLAAGERSIATLLFKPEYDDEVTAKESAAIRATEVILSRTRSMRGFGKPILWLEYWYEPAGYDNDTTHGIRNTWSAFVGGNANFTMGSLMRAHSNMGDFPPNLAQGNLTTYLLDKDLGMKKAQWFMNIAYELDTSKFVSSDSKLKEADGKSCCSMFGEKMVIYKKDGGTINVNLDKWSLQDTLKITGVKIQTGEAVITSDIKGGGWTTINLPVEDCAVVISK